MPKLIMVGLIGAAIFTFVNTYTAKPMNEEVVGAHAKIAELQAILEEEDEDLQDDEDLQEDQDLQGDEQEFDDHGGLQDDLDEQDDQEGPSQEWTTPI